jgi:hypothetical protein
MYFSHLVPILPGPHILSDILVSSPIIAGEDGVPAGFTANEQMARAIQMSMEGGSVRN